MAIAELTGQRNTYGSPGAVGSIVLTYPSTPTAGNLLVCCLTWRSNLTVTGVPSGWTLATNGGNSNGCDSAIYYKIAGSSEATVHTFTMSATGHCVGVANEYSGITTTSPLDVTGQAAGFTTTATTGATGTLAQADELIYTLWGNVRSDDSFTSWDNGLSLVGNAVSTTGTVAARVRCKTTTKIVTADTSTTYTGTMDFSQTWSIALATFKAGSSAVTHDCSGALPGLSASISGSSAHVATHSSSGVLAGQGSQVSSSANRFRSHSTSGVLSGQDSELSGTSQHKVLHSASGILTGAGSALDGAANRFSQHNASGVLPGQSAEITGSSQHIAIHNATGDLTGQIGAVSGTSAHVVTYPVRYIRDALNGSSGNGASYWVEIQAFDGDGVNIANGATVTANFTPLDGTLSLITDGDTNTNNYTSSSESHSRVVVDLGATYNIASVTRWHYNGDNRTFFGTKTETSVDGITWTVIFNSDVSGEYAEQSGGKNDVTLPAPPVNTQQLGSIIPAYTVDSGDWSDYTRTASIPGSIVIINPNSGPGTVENTTITGYVTNYHAAGGQILGYISSSYAGSVNTARTAAAVKADVDTYLSLYDVDGFFIDEMTRFDTGGNVAYYLEVYDYIKSLGAYTVVCNPGAIIDEIFVSDPVADTFVIFEGFGSSLVNFAMPTWTDSYDPSTFAWILHSVSTIGSATDIVTRARNENTYYVFVTDDVPANPYDTSPSYWADFAANLAVTSGYLVGPGSVIAGTANRVANHSVNGDLIGQDSSLTGSSNRFRLHDASGLLDGQAASIIASSTRFRLHESSGDLAGQGSELSGSSNRFRQFAADGVLTGQSSTIAGTSERTGAPSSFDASGVLTGQGANVAGSSSRFRQFTASGVLSGQGTTISSDASRTNGPVTHNGSGSLLGQSSALAGSSNRFRNHPVTGDLPGQPASINSDAARSDGPVTHNTSGSLIGQSTTIIGSSSRFRQLTASGVLPGQTAAINGSASRQNGAVTHNISGSLIGQGSEIVGAVERFRHFDASGNLVASGSNLTSESNRFRSFDSAGDLVGSGSDIDSNSNRFRSFDATGSLSGSESTLIGSSVTRKLHSCTSDLIGSGSILAGAALKGDRLTVGTITAAYQTHTITAALADLEISAELKTHTIQATI